MMEIEVIEHISSTLVTTDGRRFKLQAKSYQLQEQVILHVSTATICTFSVAKTATYE